MSSPEIDALVARSVATLRTAAGTAPAVAVILGSGWKRLADILQRRCALPYAELPAFPRVGVPGHAGELIVGRIGEREIVVLSGRQHSYETGDVDGMKGAIRTLAHWGCRILVLTNAAGSLDLAMRPGELMVIADHLNLPQRSPLFHEVGAQRFVDLYEAYDPALRLQARAAAAAQGQVVHEGVYAWMMGPQFETPAEIRMLQRLGAHAVGMSTVPETLLARHAGLRVLGLSMLTNMGCGLEATALSHAHTLSTAEAAAERATDTLAAMLQTLQ